MDRALRNNRRAHHVVLRSVRGDAFLRCSNRHDHRDVRVDTYAIASSLENVFRIPIGIGPAGFSYGEY